MLNNYLDILSMCRMIYCFLYSAVVSAKSVTMRGTALCKDLSG